MGQSQDVVEVTIKAVMPTQSGCAVFLAAPEKTFVIYVDHGIGQSISMAFNSLKKERPLTHDLMMSILTGLEAKVEHVTINDVDDGTFFARILVTMENELGRKIVELDARPSDSIVLALQSGKPIYTAQKVLDAVEDMTDILKRILKQREEDQDEDDEEPDIPF
ncbi:MAG: bifunctional nuclease family protein [Opitutales bacterium]